MKILIVEDDAVSRLPLSTTLKQLDYSVIVTDNGRDAWGAFQQEHVSIIISDWMMPDMDGLELCRLIRSEDRTRYT
jgi:two-component system cell cycle response regulator